MTLVLAWYHGEQGRQRVSGPELLIIGFLLAVAGIAVRGVLSDDRLADEAAIEGVSPVAQEVRVAVLPLEAGPSEDDQWLASGLGAELINELAAIPSLIVVGRSGVGEELDVDYLVEGQVRRAGAVVRLSIRLVSASDGSVVETVAEDRALQADSLFAFQAEAAQRVVGVIGGQLSAIQRVGETRSSPDPEAFRLYLQAGTPGTNTLQRIQRRERLLRRALELDPDFVAAAASLVRVTNWIVWNFSSEIPDGEERASEALNRLRRLGGDDVVTLRAEAEYAYRVAGDLPSALNLFDVVVQRDPGDAEALMLGGAVLRRMGRWEEAVAWMTQGFDVDPYGGIAWSLGETHQMLRDWSEAERYYRHAATVNPDNPFNQSSLAFLPIHAEGDTASARRYLETLAEPLRREVEGALYHFTGRIIEEAELLQSRPPAGTGSSMGRANRLARLGSLSVLMGDALAAEAWADSLLTFLNTTAWADRPFTRARVRSLHGLALALRGEQAAALESSLEAIDLYPPSRDAYLAERTLGTHAQILLLAGDTAGAARAVADLLTVPSGFSPWNVRLDPTWAAVTEVEPVASLLPAR